MFALACALTLMNQAVSATFVDHGRECLETIRREYYDAGTGLYRDAFEPGKPHSQVSFNWGVGVMLSALNAGAAADPKFQPWLKSFALRTDRYWNAEGPVAGFDVLPVPKPKDRYYDDNEWMVMALVETSEVLHDDVYLERADAALHFVLSGEDDKLGGGIYWRENEKSSKNACSNAPAAAACLAVYRHRHRKELLDKAIELYSWTKAHLEDPADHLVYDAVGLDGHVHDAKWSYNTALMIRSAAELYDLTHLESYAADAEAMAKSSISKWILPDPPRYNNPGRFAHLLIDALLFAAHRVPAVEKLIGPDRAVLVDPMVTLYDSIRNPKGLYPDWWSSSKPDQKVWELIGQASAARAFFELAKK